MEKKPEPGSMKLFKGVLIMGLLILVLPGRDSFAQSSPDQERWPVRSEKQIGNVPGPSWTSTERDPFAYSPKVAQTLMLQRRAAEKGIQPGTPDGSSQPAGAFALNGILWTEKGGVASINQKILREGESLEGYKITKIERQKVILKKEGEEIRLHLAQSPLEVKTHDPQPLSKKKR